MSKLQLHMGGQISQPTGLKSCSLDFQDEVRRNMREEEAVQESFGAVGFSGPTGPTGPAGAKGPIGASALSRIGATYTSAAAIRR